MNYESKKAHHGGNYLRVILPNLKSQISNLKSSRELWFHSPRSLFCGKDSLAHPRASVPSVVKNSFRQFFAIRAPFRGGIIMKHEL